MMTVAESKLRVGNRVIDAAFRDTSFTVERYEGDWAWIRTNFGLRGWLPRSHVVPLDRAVSYFTQRIAEDPSAINYQNRAVAHELLKQYDAAIIDISVAIALQPNEPALLNSRGIIYYDKEDYQRALDDYNAAIRLDPGHFMHWSNAGDARFALKQYDKAIENYSHAIQLHPNASTLYSSRGRSWQEKGDFERAMADYRRAIELDPNDLDALNSQATVWATCPIDRYRDAKLALATALRACEVSTWSKAVCVSTLSESYAEAGDFENAVKYAEQALEMARKEKWKDLSILEKEVELFKARQPYRMPAVSSR